MIILFRKKKGDKKRGDERRRRNSDPEMLKPIRGQDPGHVITLNQSEAGKQEEGRQNGGKRLEKRHTQMSFDYQVTNQHLK